MTVKDHAAKPPTVTSSAKQARMETENFWQIDGRDIVREDVRMTVFPARERARALEVELTWQALKAPVTLRGSQEPGKSYGGFSARFAARENTILRADGETLSKDEDLTPRKWAELGGVYGGKRGRQARHSAHHAGPGRHWFPVLMAPAQLRIRGRIFSRPHRRRG